MAAAVGPEDLEIQILTLNGPRLGLSTRFPPIFFKNFFILKLCGHHRYLIRPKLFSLSPVTRSESKEKSEILKLLLLTFPCDLAPKILDILMHKSIDLMPKW